MQGIVKKEFKLMIFKNCKFIWWLSGKILELDRQIFVTVFKVTEFPVEGEQEL